MAAKKMAVAKEKKSKDEYFHLLKETFEGQAAHGELIRAAVAQLVTEVAGVRKALERLETTELKDAVGRLGQRIGEYIEHQFHSVK